MFLAGPNLYKVSFRIDKIKDVEFQRLVVAHSDKEAVAHVGEGVVKVMLVDSDISMTIPDQYLKPHKGEQL